MITRLDNLFHAVARDLVNSKADEAYLVAGLEFNFLQPSDELRRVLNVAIPVSGAANAAEALAIHFNHCVEAQTSHAIFCADCGGFIHVGTPAIVVQFKVRQISDTPVTFRVLFTRLDALMLATNMEERMDALEKRLADSEKASNDLIALLGTKITKLEG